MLMGTVRDGIVMGTAQVVYDLNMEEKYQRAAMRALEDGMRHVAKQFEAYMAVSGGGSAGGDDRDPGSDTGFWEPPTFDEAVCCMPGMDCWTGDFANAAGRAKIIEGIARLEAELVGATEEFDILNAENEREASAARAIALAEARDLAAKLVNRIADAEKIVTKAEAAMAGLGGEELEIAEAALATARLAVLSLQEESRAGDEAYAMLSQEDAAGRVGLLELETEQRAEHIANLEAENTFERGLLAQYAADG